MTNFMKRAADAVVDKLLELMQRDRAAQEAKPKSAESPLIVIPIPKWRTYFALAFITVFFLGLVCRAVWLQAVTTDFLQDQGEARYARTLNSRRSPLPVSAGKFWTAMAWCLRPVSLCAASGRIPHSPKNFQPMTLRSWPMSCR